MASVEGGGWKLASINPGTRPLTFGSATCNNMGASRCDGRVPPGFLGSAENVEIMVADMDANGGQDQGSSVSGFSREMPDYHFGFLNCRLMFSRDV